MSRRNDLYMYNTSTASLYERGIKRKHVNFHLTYRNYLYNCLNSFFIILDERDVILIYYISFSTKAYSTDKITLSQEQC